MRSSHPTHRSPTQAVKVSRGNFLKTPDDFSEDETHFYFGWASINDGWLIERQVRKTAARKKAAQDGGAKPYQDAWAGKEALTYSTI